MLFRRSIPILLAFLILLTPILIDANDIKDKELIPYLKERYQPRGIGPYYSYDSLLVISVSPKMAADRDAGMDLEGGFSGVSGVGVAHVIESTPGTTTFLWESPEYIAAQTGEYRSMGNNSKIYITLDSYNISMILF